jgi:ZIP family zinc transporter
VFFARQVNRRFLDAMLGFAAGVMIAASYWSLLAPAIALSEALDAVVWLPPAAGFLLGGAAIWGADKILPHFHPGLARAAAAEGPQTTRAEELLVRPTLGRRRAGGRRDRGAVRAPGAART